MTTLTADELMAEADIERTIEALLNEDGDLDENMLSKLIQPVAPDRASPPTKLITIWNTTSGAPHVVPAWMVTGQNSLMRRKNADGSFVFSAKQVRPWTLGNIPCMLNPKYEHYDDMMALGIVGEPCEASHLRSLFARRLHMAHRHSQEWATIQEEEQLARDRIYRDEQRVIAEAARMAVSAATAVSAPATAIAEPPVAEFVCDICGEVAKSAAGLSGHKRFKHELKKD